MDLAALSDEQIKNHPPLMPSDWQLSRMAFVKKMMPGDFWKNKTLLELGACDGTIGNMFSELGAIVTCVEGKDAYVRFIKNKHPHLNVLQADCDTDKWVFGKYDIIVNFGLLYHLENNHEAFLTNCIKNCACLFLESVIYDSPNNELYYREEMGAGQGLSGKAGTPTTSFVETILQKNNALFTKYSDPSLNAGGHNYSWPDCNSGFDCARRRFWIVNCSPQNTTK